MSARILPFTGEWQGHTEPKPNKGKRQPLAESRAIHDARLIREAKSENDDWTARTLLALLLTLGSKQRDLLEFHLLGPTMDSQSAVQALAIVQLIKGTNAHRKAVRSHLEAFATRGAE